VTVTLFELEKLGVSPCFDVVCINMTYIALFSMNMLKNVKILIDKVWYFLYNADMVSSNLMTIEDLAGYLKVTRRTIYDWLKHNKIPALKLVGQWRFKKDKIDAWLDNQSQ